MDRADRDVTGDVVARASALVAARQFQHAVDVARAGLTQDPDDPRLLVALTVALTELGDGPGASEAGCRAVAAAPEWATAHGALGDAHLIATRCFPAAIAAYNEAIRLDPTRYGYFTGRSQASVQLTPAAALLTPPRRRHREAMLHSARSDAEFALRLAPNAPLCHVALGKVLLADDQPGAAMAAADRALAIDPTNGAAFQIRGLALKRLGDVRGASEAFVSAGKQNPRSDAPVQGLRALKAAPFTVFGVWLAFRVIFAAGRAGPAMAVIAVIAAAGALAWWWQRQRGIEDQLSPEAREALRVDRALRRTARLQSWRRLGRGR